MWGQNDNCRITVITISTINNIQQYGELQANREQQYENLSSLRLFNCNK